MIRRAAAFALAILAVGAPPAARAQRSDTARPQAADTTHAQVAAPVIFGADTLFLIQSRLGPYAASERADAIVQRIRRVASDPRLRGDTATVVEADGAADVVVGDVVVLAVTDADAKAAGVDRRTLAATRAHVVTRAIRNESWLAIAKTVLVGLLFTLIATAVLMVIIKLLNRLFPAIYAKINGWRGTKIPALRIQRLELLSSARLADALIGAAKILRVVLVVVLLFYYVPLIFSFFPWTQGFASTLFGYIVAPLRQVATAVVGYIPNLFYIAIIVLVTRYLLRFIRFFFDSVERGVLQFPGFYDDWARPTYKLVRFFVLAFALVVLFPYLPGSESAAFKGVSVFLGVLVSFGSSSAVANVVSGVVLTYMRPFQIGDRVKIADTVGDVVDRTLLVTRVRTIKNVDITIPNAMVLSSHIDNYTSLAQELGLILHTGVTIGYDAPWRKVHELLIAAAEKTERLMADPKPFVLQTSLDDSYVSYQLNAYTDRPGEMAQTYSELHQHIQDAFNEAGVEIMSPHYEALRDGNTTTVPPKHRPKSYTPPMFRIAREGDKGS